MFCQRLEKTLNCANHYAAEKAHAFIGLEHLLLALLDNPEAVELLQSIGVDCESIRGEIKLYLESLQSSPKRPSSNLQLEHTDAFKRVIQRAIFHAQTLSQAEVNGAYALTAIMSENDSQAFHILQQYGVSKIVLHQKLANNGPSIDIIPTQEPNEQTIFQQQDAEQDGESIEQFAVNLNSLALRGEIDQVVGRDEEVRRLEQILCRRRKNNPILVGEAGVGKTALAEALALRIVEKKVHPLLQNMTVYSIDMGCMLAGTKYRGDFEKRFKKVLKKFSMMKNATIFIDEIHSIIGTGAASGGSMDAANLLKPLLTRGNLRCIGATTYNEYRQLFEKDHALSRRFQKIDVKETSTAQTLNILRNLKDKLESHHNVHYSNTALKAAVDLSKRYMHDRFLPDKAIDILDEAGSAKSLSAHTTGKSKQIDVRDIEKIVSSLTQIPTQHVSSSDKDILCNLERDLNMLIYGQPNALKHVSNAIKLSRSGLGDQNKPIGSFLFAGPTGVGKTELAKQIASILNLKLIRFDMSEFMEKHSSSQLVGAPAGYVGYDQGGQLTEAVIKNPYAVLLLDEIEKAHHDLLNLLLQVMDHGKLTDNTGRVADFRHVVIIMTSNCGSQEQSKNKLGFVGTAKQTGLQKAVELGFSPEFRNRLDAVVEFNPLTKKNISQIVDKFIANFEVSLQAQGLEMHVDNAVKDYLIEHGYDPKMGARPMERAINNCIKKPIADELLQGGIRYGDKINVKMKSNQVVISIVKKPSKVKNS